MGTIKQLRWWAYKILPLVYDDSLSYYEVISKVTQKLNEVVDTTNKLPDAISEEIKNQLSGEEGSDVFDNLFNGLINAIATKEADEVTYTPNEKQGGELVWLGDTLYEVTSPMASGTNYIVGTNIVPVDISDELKEIKGYISTHNEYFHERATEAHNAQTYLYWKDVLYRADKDINVNDILGTDGQLTAVNTMDEITSHYAEMHESDNNLQTQIDGNDGDIEKLQAEDINLQNQITNNNSALTNRIDNIVAQAGTDNTEIVDARQGAEKLGSPIYTNLGQAIREQVTLALTTMRDTIYTLGQDLLGQKNTGIYITGMEIDPDDLGDWKNVPSVWKGRTSVIEVVMKYLTTENQFVTIAIPTTPLDDICISFDSKNWHPLRAYTLTYKGTVLQNFSDGDVLSANKAGYYISGTADYSNFKNIPTDAPTTGTAGFFLVVYTNDSGDHMNIYHDVEHAYYAVSFNGSKWRSNTQNLNEALNYTVRFGGSIVAVFKDKNLAKANKNGWYLSYNQTGWVNPPSDLPNNNFILYCLSANSIDHLNIIYSVDANYMAISYNGSTWHSNREYFLSLPNLKYGGTVTSAFPDGDVLAANKDGYYISGGAPTSDFTNLPSDRPTNSAGFFLMIMTDSGPDHMNIYWDVSNAYFATSFNATGWISNYSLMGRTTISNGKKWYSYGDSIAYGVTSKPDAYVPTNSYLYMYNEYYRKGEFINKAIGGTTFAKLKELVDTVDYADADLITVAYGINNWWWDTTPLGTKDDDSSAETVAGQIKYAIEKFTTNAPQASLVFLTPLNSSIYGTIETGYGLNHAGDKAGFTINQLAQLIIDICNEYQIAYIDMTHNNPVVNLLNIKTQLGDGVHPVVATTKKFVGLLQGKLPT